MASPCSLVSIHVENPCGRHDKCKSSLSSSKPVNRLPIKISKHSSLHEINSKQTSFKKVDTAKSTHKVNKQNNYLKLDSKIKLGSTTSPNPLRRHLFGLHSVALSCMPAKSVKSIMKELVDSLTDKINRCLIREKDYLRHAKIKLLARHSEISTHIAITQSATVTHVQIQTRGGKSHVIYVRKTLKYWYLSLIHI